MKNLIFTALLATASMYIGAKGIEVTGEAYARPTVEGQHQGGAFLTLHNDSAQANKLLSASTNIAARSELHTHINDNGVMRMRKVQNGLTIPAHGDLELKPGSYHIMFFDLKQPLKEGDTFPLRLKFQHGSSKTITVQVHSMQDSATNSEEHHHH